VDLPLEEAVPPVGDSMRTSVPDLVEQLRRTEHEVDRLTRQLTTSPAMEVWEDDHELPQMDVHSMLGMDARMLSLLWAALPPSVHMHTWSLCFRLSDHGASLRTLYQKVAERPDVTETVLLVRDTNGYVFGALAMKPWAEATRHYGGGEMMVFKCGRATDVEGRQSARSSISGSPGSVRRGAQFRRFGRTGKNDLFQLARPDSLCVGGGGQGYALWLDGDLSLGTSLPSDTFANSCLASGSRFQVQEIELWGLLL